MLKFTIDKQIIKRVDDFDLVTDSINYVVASFGFGEDWTGYEKKVIFEDHSGAYELDLDENNTCVVPYEVLRRDDDKEFKRFKVSAYGAKDVKRITTNRITIKVRNSGYREDISDFTDFTDFLTVNRLIDESEVIEYDGNF